MKRKIFISLIISFITVLGLNVSAQADTTTTQVTSNSWEDSMPQIKGNYVVWQGHVNGHWQIFLYNNIENEDPTQITNHNYDSISPRTDGNYVVWSGKGIDGVGSIYSEILLYNIASGETSPITDDNTTCIDSSPQIANGRVVWTSHVVGDSVQPGEINLYDIANATTTLLSTSDDPLDPLYDPNNTLDDISPRINSQFVVWLQIDEDDNSTLFRYLLPDGPALPAPEGFIWEDSPQTDGDLTVSMRNDGSDWNIIIRKDGQDGFEQVTNNTLDDRYPSISGNNIAWMGGKGQASEIYIAQYTATAEVCSLADFAANFGRTDCSGPCECDYNSDNDVDGSDLAMLSQN